MRKLLTGWRVWLSVAIAVALLGAGAGVFLVTANRATAELQDWPPLTMTYTVGLPVSCKACDDSMTQVMELVYRSRHSWTETVIEADPVVTRWGTDNFVGSYQKVEGSQYTYYDSTGAEPETEALEEGVVMQARGGLYPMPIKLMEEHFDAKATEVTTASKVCFDDVCTENAPGWQLVLEGRTVVLADDARGIPVQVGGLAITEVRVEGAQEPVDR